MSHTTRVSTDQKRETQQSTLFDVSLNTCTSTSTSTSSLGLGRRIQYHTEAILSEPGIIPSGVNCAFVVNIRRKSHRAKPMITIMTIFGPIRNSRPLLFRNPRSLLLAVAVGFFFAFALVEAFSVIPSKTVAVQREKQGDSHLFSSAITGGTAPVLKSLLKKPSKVLTVGVEYAPTSVGEKQDLEVFSMKLRQQAKLSSIVCSDLDAIRLLRAEQETAKGNFPGPVPIIYCNANAASPEDILEAGATAIVVDAGTTERETLAELAHSTGLETIWKVSTTEEAEQVLELTEKQADVFWLDVDVDDEDKVALLIGEIAKVLPKSSMAIGVLREPMQADGAEIGEGKEFKSMGCASVFVKKACVGDKEDIDYASFVVSGLTSKASSEFKFSGLTGSINGHFGGIQSNGSVQWERTTGASTKESTNEE